MTAHSLLEVTLFVADVDESAAFYRAIGCAVFEWNEPGYTRHFDATIRDTIIQLFPSSERHRVSHTQLGFKVTSIDAVIAALEATGIRYELPGPKRLAAADPDGNRVHVTEVY